ncbi:MAG: hypothetical protein IPF99_09250 [Deltaproteobacteria bacterium]|nr:hypothetical protein [Deltaproteobacteria bacterium]
MPGRSRDRRGGHPRQRQRRHPTFIGGVADGRRVQSFVVEPSAPRVRLRVLGPANRVRYEAVVEADRLVDLGLPEGSAAPDGFTFDLTRYPAR